MSSNIVGQQDNPAAAGTLPAAVPGYELLRDLGRGHTGVVHKARQLLHGRTVALKVVNDETLGGAHDLTAFAAAGRAAMRLAHPNIVTLYEVGDAAGQPYLASEFMEGESLRQRLGRAPLPADEAARLVETLARAVQYAHEKGVVHGHLSPANVLLGPDDTPRIGDFGLAVFLGGSRPGHPFPADPAYAAPEQAGSPASGGPPHPQPPSSEGRGEKDAPDLRLQALAGPRKHGTLPGPVQSPMEPAAEQHLGPAVDVYGLGAVLYTLLTGRPPLLGASREQTLELVRSRRPVPPGRLQPGLPADLEAVCLKCLSKRPGRRYRSALELAEALRRCREGRRAQAGPAALVGRAARWCRDNPAAIFGVLALVFAAALALSIRDRRSALHEREQADAEYRAAVQRAQEVSLLRDQEASEKTAAQQQAQQGQMERTTALQARDEMRTRLAEKTRAWQNAVAAYQAETAKRVDAQERALAAEERRKQADERRAEFARNLAGMHVASGTRLLDQGDLAGSLPWFVQALRLAQVERLPEEAHRLRLAATLSRCARPVRLWHSDKRLNVVRLSPDGRQVLAAGTEGALVLWDSGTGKAGEPMLHGVAVTDAVFSADGKRVLTADADHAVHLWDLETGKEATPVMPHTGPVLGLAFRPDGKQVLTVSARGPQGPADAEVRLWDAASGEPSENPLGSQVAPFPAEFSPDGKRVLTVCLDRCARVWDAAGGNQVGASLEHPAAVRRASFSPDGRLVVTAGADGTARLWDAATGRPVLRPLHHGAPVADASFSAGGKYVLTAGDDRLVRVWDPATGEPIGQPMRHDEPLTRAAFSPDGRLVLAADEGGVVCVWDAATGAAVVPPLRQGGAVRHAAFDPAGRVVLTAEDRVVRLWDLAAAEPPAPEVGESRGLVFSMDGRRAVRVEGRTLRVLDARNGKPTGTVLEHERDVKTVAFSPAGKRLLAVCPEGEGAEVHIWDMESGKKIGKALDHARPVTGASFSPDGKRVLTVCGDKKVRVWDAAAGDLLGQPLDHNGDLDRALFGPGEKVLSIDVQGTVRVWDPASGTQVGRAFGPAGPLHHLGFSRDGKQVVTTGSDGTARVWDLATGEAVTKWMLHGAAVMQAAFSPDGKRLATASADRTARVWDAESGDPVTPPLRHRSAVALAVFSAGGRRLLTAAGNSVRLWDIATGEAIGPELPHGHSGAAIHFASLDGGRLVTAVGSPGDPAGRWERTLRPDDRPLQDLEQMAGVHAASRVDAGGNNLPLEGKEAASAWQALRQKYAADWTAGEERVRAWERRAAGECEARGLWPGAIVHLDRLLEAAPAADLYARRARAHAELRQWEPALADYTKALGGDAGRADLWAGRAGAAAALGRWDEAVADCTRAIELKGGDADLWAKRGWAEAERGRWQQAAADLGKAIALGRTGAGLRHQHALALLAAGDREGYRRVCTRLVQRGGGGDDEASLRLLSRTCTLDADAVPDLEPLVRRAEKATEMDPRSAADQERLGALLYRTGKHEMAVRRLEGAVRLAGSEPTPRALLFLAMANQRLGRGEEARKRVDDAAAREKGGTASWVERLEYQIVRREAEALVKPPKP